MRKQLFLHIGVHRTGTTSIQNFLAENRKLLVKQSVYYPPGTNQNNVKWLLTNGPSHQLSAIGATIYSKELSRDAERANAQKIILSGEDFSQLSNINMLKPFRDHFDTKIIVYLRRQDQWLNSWYNQHIRWPWDAELCTLSCDDFFAVRKEFFWIDYAKLLDKWAKIFGVNNLIVRTFETDTSNGNLEHDFCDACQLDYYALSPPQKRRNISARPLALEFLRHMRLLDKSSANRYRLINIVNQIALEKTHDARKYSFSDAQMKLVLKEFEASNQYVANQYLQRGTNLFKTSTDKKKKPESRAITLPEPALLNNTFSTPLLLSLTKLIESNLHGQQKARELKQSIRDFKDKGLSLENTEISKLAIKDFILQIDLAQFTPGQIDILTQQILIFSNTAAGDKILDSPLDLLNSERIIGGIITPLADSMLELIHQLITSKKEDKPNIDCSNATSGPICPTFLAIGPPKTATTWMYHALSHHPDVKLPPIKEIRYFWEKYYLHETRYLARFKSKHWHFVEMRKYYRERITKQIKNIKQGQFLLNDFLWNIRFIFGRHTDQWYKTLFDTAAITGDITPKYSELSDQAVEQIHSDFPETKIIISLRDPIERDWSRAKMNLCKRRNRRIDEVPLEEWLTHFDDPSQTFASDYLALYQRWADAFGKESVFLYYYDELQEDSWSLFRNLCSFLNIAPPNKRLKKYVNQQWHVGIEGEIPTELRAYLIQKHRNNIADFISKFPEHSYPIKWLSNMEKGP